ncbi:glycoside hydrolase family 16 protein [Neolewinella lacunae]|uniref:Glycoside hydrolase family 16 protein n=1 Tax=Neolewinella lacunae TaxID=1517758 RepID=A0A923T950_9BACT|nr:glycoside hydrolase family 16 protein [Neolewinella lacunae]MBC6994678.1 glycoside hydrolase family 16 protein [Neolewinella lacunae]MDN3634550.1 glycoside hydrolase family 16 protein [Neolewinella lacunae]
MIAKLFQFSLLLVAVCLLTTCKNQNTDASSATTSIPAGEGAYVPEGYELVWNDEFDGGPLPDTTRWTYQTGGFGWTAKELQNYLHADPDNVGVEDGLLRITAIAEKSGRNNYTSTRLVSKGKASFTRGYFEVRAKFPRGAGLRSSFWMVGDTVSKMGWPKAGEIDLVEYYGAVPDKVNAAVQTTNNYWSKKNQFGGGVTVPDAQTEFHVYSCTWTEEQIDFAVDGQTYWSYLPGPDPTIEIFPFRWPFYMAATLAVGGIRGPESAGDNTALPASMYLDYVRVYQKPE